MNGQKVRDGKRALVDAMRAHEPTKTSSATVAGRITGATVIDDVVDFTVAATMIPTSFTL